MIERSISITTHCVLTKDPYEFTVLNKPVNPYPIEYKLNNLILSASYLQINAVFSCCRERFKYFDKPAELKLETAPKVDS